MSSEKEKDLSLVVRARALLTDLDEKYPTSSKWPEITPDELQRIRDLLAEMTRPLSPEEIVQRRQGRRETPPVGRLPDDEAVWARRRLPPEHSELMRRCCAAEYSSSPLWRARAEKDPDFWSKFSPGGVR